MKNNEKDYTKMWEGLRKAYKKGIIDDLEIHNIIELTNQLIEYVSRDNETVKKEVFQIMGGRIIELESDRIFIRGDDEGRQEGLKLGEARYKKLTKMLMESKRYSDLEKACNDEEFLQKLYEEFGL